MINFLLLSVVFSYGNGNYCPQQCSCAGDVVSCFGKIQKDELSHFFNETSKDLQSLSLADQDYTSFNICQLKNLPILQN